MRSELAELKTQTAETAAVAKFAADMAWTGGVDILQQDLAHWEFPPIGGAFSWMTVSFVASRSEKFSFGASLPEKITI